MHHSNRNPLQFQQTRIQKHAKNTNSYQFFNTLTGPELFSEVEALLPEHRERVFPPTETLSMFLAQVMNPDSSCQNAVNDAAISRLVGGLTSCSTATGGYCKARQRLPTDMISKLAVRTGELLDNNCPNQWRWKGKKVRLIDGTTALMPDTEKNKIAYPKHKGQKEGLGFPICRMVGVVCLSSGAILNAAISKFNGKGSSEQTLLRQLLETFDNGDVVLGDAYFGTYFLLAALQEKGVDALFEQLGARKRTVDFSQGEKLGPQDHIITLKKPKTCPDLMTKDQYYQAPESLDIRELKVNGKILISTFMSAKENPKHILKDLYKSRWHVELDLRNIKTTLGMEMLHCKTPEMNEKEIWVYFLAYNLIRLLMAQAALLADILPRQISFKHSLQLWLSWSMRTEQCQHENLVPMFIMMAQNRVANRGGRIEPRAIKRRPKTYPLLTKMRHLAQAEVRANGHPKKLK
jgi:hypothetical protein